MQTPALLIGGPLDGQTYTAVRAWPHYLGDDGKPLIVKIGDRIFGRAQLRGDAKHRSCYITRLDYATKVRTYVHSTVRNDSR